MADTKLTIEQVEYALAKHFGIRQNVIVTNVSWGFLAHEADLIVMSKGGYLTEVEIKRSFSDFMADFKKDHTHNDPKISYLYYAIPVSIKEKVIDEIKKRNIRCGILVYDEEANIKVHEFSPFVNKENGYKLFIEERFEIARLGCMRVWKLKEKLSIQQKELFI